MSLSAVKVSESVRNAQKALLPIGLLKTALEKAIIAGEQGGYPVPTTGDIYDYDEDGFHAHEIRADIALYVIFLLTFFVFLIEYS